MIVSCGRHDCAWEWYAASEDEADRRLTVHLQQRHGLAPAEPLVRISLADWEALADDAVAKVAARGETFLLWEALREHAVPDHPDPKSGMGRYATRVHRRGLAHPCAFGTSPRPGTNESSIRRWTGDSARCSDDRCRGVLVR